MGWHSPKTWAEIAATIEYGLWFNSSQLVVQAHFAHRVCGQDSTRGVLYGHLDDFAHRIIESNDDLHSRYTTAGFNRVTAERDDDVTYFVTRDGNAIAYLTRVNEVVINPQAERGLPRYRNAVRHLRPALEVLASKRITWS